MKAALLMLLITAMLPVSVRAACNPPYVQTELGCLPDNPVDFSGKIYSIGLGLVGGVGLIALLYGGYLIIVSKGDPVTLNKGKSYIFYALLGIVMAVSGFALYHIAAVDILQIPGFGR